MSVIHLNHIRGELERNAIPKLDLTDISNQDSETTQSTALSRSYAFFALKSFTDLDYEAINESVTDGYNDYGIDCLYWDRRNNNFYIIQSKWIKSAQGGPNRGDVLKFIEGLEKLLVFDFDGFNEKIRSKSKIVEDAFLDSDVKVILVLAHTGNNIASNIQETIDKKLDELNDADEVIFFREFNIENAHRSLVYGIEGNPIDAEIDILQWGKTEDPVKSVYGQVNCEFFANVYKDHKRRLFSKNIRGFMGGSNINSEIIHSLLNKPESFIYLNNGITILTKRLTKSPYGGNERKSGHYKCEDVTIVNGAQTVGSIQEAYKKQPEKVAKAYVFTRVISLENCPEDFGRKVTIATNMQNKIEKRDFVSLDPEQQRLKTELLLENIKYHIKRDQSLVNKNEKNIYLEEATVALACQYSDVDLSTYAKREISRLWDDTQSAPYKLIFNSELRPKKFYKTVFIKRCIEEKLNKTKWNQRDKETLITVHGFYLIAHLVFQEIDKELLNNPKREIQDSEIERIEELTDKVKKNVIDAYQSEYPNRFPPTVFKNVNSIRSLKKRMYKLEGKSIPGETLYLFNDYTKKE